MKVELRTPDDLPIEEFPALTKGLQEAMDKAILFHPGTRFEIPMQPENGQNFLVIMGIKFIPHIMTVKYFVNWYGK